MKKIIAAAAGLMLAGTMAVTATATETERPQLTIKGDARTRLHLQRDFLNGKETNDFISSRIRVTSKYKAKGGAYAIIRARFADATWDGTKSTGNQTEKTNFKIDKAWIGVPVGPVTIEGGYTPTTVTRFTHFDERDDRLSFTYKNEGTVLKGFYDKDMEFTGDATIDYDDDEDKNTYGLQLNQDLGEEWKLVALAAYQDDETPVDDGGFIASVSGFGKIAGLGAEIEVMFVEDGAMWGDTIAAGDDAWGGQFSLSGKAGDVAMKGSLGFTDNGFKADQDFGYLMIGSYSPITNVTNIGQGGDTIWAGFTAGFKVSDKTKITGNLVYLDVDGSVYESFLEVSGQVTYSVSEGASLSAGLGLVETDTAANYDQDTAIGAFGTMDITF